MTRASGVSYYLNDEETLLVGTVRERGRMPLSGAMGGL